MASHSCGPFSRVFFFHTLRNGLRTYTKRHHRTEQGFAPLGVVGGTFAGGANFLETYVDTAALPAALPALPARLLALMQANGQSVMIA